MVRKYTVDGKPTRPCIRRLLTNLYDGMGDAKFLASATGTFP